MECMRKLQMMVILIDLLILYQNQVHEKTETFCFFILSNLDTHIHFVVVLLDKVPLHVSGWLAHHQEVRMCTVHAANGLPSLLCCRCDPNGRNDSLTKKEDH